ncbi:hypothetical protein B4135_3525 [Caldibacillus debilis]|uniref:HTH gntR-type domain-containing protein n=1 Tax=Caldibacillus debilis TaxID=301148 RepID=A0A150LDP8_9BACI|nr:hypothetical protein B4135_3525 [Caldibacillus debilis]
MKIFPKNFGKGIVKIVINIYIVYRKYIQYLQSGGAAVNILLSQTSKTPLYLQIKEQIKEQIMKGILKEGDPLPSMRELAKDLRVSVITTKRAYEELEQEGFLVSTVGRGTFVAGQQTHVLREWRIRELENQLESLVIEGKRLGLSEQELVDMVRIYYKEGGR